MSEVNSKQYSDLFKVNCLNSKYVRKVDKKSKALTNSPGKYLQEKPKSGSAFNRVSTGPLYLMPFLRLVYTKLSNYSIDLSP